MSKQRASLALWALVCGFAAGVAATRVVTSGAWDSYLVAGDNANDLAWFASMAEGTWPLHGHTSSGHLHPSPLLYWFTGLIVGPLAWGSDAPLTYLNALGVATLAGKSLFIAATGAFIGMSWRSAKAGLAAAASLFTITAVAMKPAWVVAEMGYPTWGVFAAAAILSGTFAVLMGSKTAIPWLTLLVVAVAPAWLPLFYSAIPALISLSWALLRTPQQRAKAGIAAGVGLIPLAAAVAGPGGIGIVLDPFYSTVEALRSGDQEWVSTQLLTPAQLFEGLEYLATMGQPPLLWSVVAALMLGVPFLWLCFAAATRRIPITVPIVTVVSLVLVAVAPKRAGVELPYGTLAAYGVVVAVMALAAGWAAQWQPPRRPAALAYAPLAGFASVALIAAVGASGWSATRAVSSVPFYTTVTQAADWVEARADDGQALAVLEGSPVRGFETLAAELVWRGREVCFLRPRVATVAFAREDPLPVVPERNICNGRTLANALLVMAWSPEEAPAEAWSYRMNSAFDDACACVLDMTLTASELDLESLSRLSLRVDILEAWQSGGVVVRPVR